MASRSNRRGVQGRSPWTISICVYVSDIDDQTSRSYLLPKLPKDCGLVFTNGGFLVFSPVDLHSWFPRVIEWTTPEVPAYCLRLNQEMNMSAPKHPKPDLPIHLQQTLLLAASVLRRIKEKQAQKEKEE